MKYKSWEIIIAGLLFVGFSAYLIQKKENDKTISNVPDQPAQLADSLKIAESRKEIRITALKQLSELEELKHLESLKDLEKLGNLEKLKSLAGFLPAEAQSDFIDEIDRAIQAIDTQLSAVRIDIKNTNGEAAVPVTATTKSWSRVSPGVYAYVEHFDASNLRLTELALPFGSIAITGSNGETATITIRASGKIHSPEDLQAKLSPAFSFSNTKAALKFKTQRNIDNLHLQATLQIPSGTKLDATTNGGHIEVKDMHAQQDYNTKGGHITLNNIGGQVDAKTAGGHITLNKGSGNIRLETVGGHITVSEADASLNVRTSGGNINGENISGKWTAFTTAGNIEVQMNAISGDSDFKTGAGSVTLWLPAKVHVRIDGAGSAFEMDPKFNFSGQQSTSGAKGSIGNGGPLIEMRTNYGKVSVKAQ